MRWPHPFVLALGAGAAVLLAAFTPALWTWLSGRPATPAVTTLDSPWLLQREADGAVRGFGLRLPGSTLGDAARRWGSDMEVALITHGPGNASLEGYVERWEGGGATGKLVLVADAPAEALQAWLARADRRPAKSPLTERWRVAAADLPDALRTPLGGLTFLPSAQLDARTLQDRLGSPAERRPDGQGREQWLYPDRGLAVLLDGQGPEVMQLVAPADFDRRLRAPLVR